MTTRFWWKVRNWWHYPQMMYRCYKVRPYSYGLSILLLQIRYPVKEIPKKQRYVTLIKMLWRDLVVYIRFIYWYLRWLQPFRCSGDKGGLRTKICNWLEDKARSKE